MSDVQGDRSGQEFMEAAAMNDANSKDSALRPTAAAGKYLTFGLGEEVYGLEILKVQEIIGLMKVTRVPGLPEVIRGVVNLRGKVIPVVDLRRKFSMDMKPDTERTCIIVVKVWRDGRAVTVGLIVDEVREVQAVTDDQLEAVPRFTADVETPYLLGIAKMAQRVVLLLDVDQILSSAELWALPIAQERDVR